MRKRILIIAISMMLCSISLFSYGADLNELNEQKNEIQNQINESTQKLQEVDSELSESLQQIEKIDISIITSEQNLKELNTNIEQINQEINTINTKLENTTKRYNEKKDILEKRLVAKYESGKTTYLDFLLSSRTLMQFISNCYLISELTEYDNDLLNTIEEEKNQIDSEKKTLEEKEKKLEEKRQIQIKTEKVLENSKALRETYIAKLTEEEKKIQNEIDECYSQLEIIDQEIRSLATIESFGPEYIGGAMVWPIPNHYMITSEFGMRTHPITGVYKLHTGFDIGAPMGTDFVAAAYGKVVKAGYNTAYGNMVVIDHGGGVQTLYAHGSEIMVELEQVVNPGDVVIKVGSTGYSTGPHAHFEVRLNGEPLNPLEYVSAPNENKNEDKQEIE